MLLQSSQSLCYFSATTVHDWLMVKWYSSPWETNVVATERLLPYWIIKCYLLPDTGECVLFWPQPDRPRPVLNLPTPEGCKAELNLVLVIYWDSLEGGRTEEGGWEERREENGREARFFKTAFLSPPSFSILSLFSFFFLLFLRTFKFQQGCLGKCCELPQRGLRRSPSWSRIWCNKIWDLLATILIIFLSL